MKVALCFIISYKHILYKEDIWKEWIEYNKDIINVYFHYKDLNLIRSPWIKQYCLPQSQINSTTYFHVVPAYMGILSYAFSHDLNNKWFCLLTESCVPIISPQQFRKLFFYYYSVSFLTWKPSYWNIQIHSRANLKYLNKEYHLANEPWFNLSRSHVQKCLLFLCKKNDIYQQICKGGLANESIFAIILQTFKELTNSWTIINQSRTITNWEKMSNATSPHVFTNNKEDLNYINNQLKENKFAMFLRKISIEFPDDILKNIIYNTNYNHDYSDSIEYTNKIKNNNNLNLVLLFIGVLLVLVKIYYLLFM